LLYLILFRVCISYQLLALWYCGVAQYRVKIGYLATVIGAGILGVGMAVGGTCPGTVWAQMGSGSTFSLAMLLVGYAAAWLFGAVHDAGPGQQFWGVAVPSKVRWCDVT
jgi:uncharacterized membrane protein YedE/YeeE